jgi:hypothetical protein
MLQASPHREHLLLTHPRTAFEHLITSFTDAEKSKIWLD